MSIQTGRKEESVGPNREKWHNLSNILQYSIFLQLLEDDPFQNWFPFWFAMQIDLRCTTECTYVETHWPCYIPSEDVEWNVSACKIGFVRCLIDGFQSALHDKIICQRVEDVHDLEIPHQKNHFRPYRYRYVILDIQPMLYKWYSSSLSLAKSLTNWVYHQNLTW